MGLFGPPNVEKMKTKKNIGGLIKALGYSNKNIRDAAAKALFEIGEPTVEPLIKSLLDIDGNTRRGAAKVLGEIRDPRSYEPLIAALKDEWVSVREDVAEALEKMDCVPVSGEAAAWYRVIKGNWVEAADLEALAVKPLIAALKERRPEVREAVAKTFGKIGDSAVEPLMGALKNGSIDLPSAFQAFVHIGEKAVTPLFDTLLTGNLGKDIWKEAEELVTIGAPVVEPIIAILSDKSKVVHGTPIARQYGNEVSLVAKSDTLKVIQYANDLQGKFFNSLQETSLNVREAAAMWVLGEIGDPRAVEPLIAALKNKDTLTRWTAAGALFTIGDTQSLEALLAALNDEDLLVSGGHYGVWGLRGDGRTVKRLIAGLMDENEDMRKASAESLGKLGWKTCS